MYIPEFVCGVIATVGIEILIIVIIAIFQGKKKK